MHKHSDIFALMDKTSEALRAHDLDSKQARDDAYQCLFAARIILDTLKSDQGKSDITSTYEKAEQSLTKLYSTLYPYTGRWDDVKSMISQIEHLKSSIKSPSRPLIG